MVCHGLRIPHGMSTTKGLMTSMHVDACLGREHLLSQQSQDSTTGKCSGFKMKQTCIRILTPRLPVGSWCVRTSSSPHRILHLQRGWEDGKTEEVEVRERPGTPGAGSDKSSSGKL